MAHEQFGELAALVTAVLWTLSAVAWTSAGKYIGALAVSFLRLVLAVGLLMLFGYLSRDRAWPSDLSQFVWLMLGLSGFLGFFVSDLCLFKAFLLIGPRLSLLMTSLTPPITVLISWACRGEGLGPRAWLGMGVTLAGVLWVVLERRDGDEHPHSRKQLRRGLILAFVAANVQAVAMVLAKVGTLPHDPPAALALIRVVGAVVGFTALITLLGRWRAMVLAARQYRAMLILTGGTIVGPTAGVTTLMIALQTCHVGVVTTILATIPVMILPFSIYLYRERVSFRAFGGAAVAAAGIAVLMWPG